MQSNTLHPEEWHLHPKGAVTPHIVKSDTLYTHPTADETPLTSCDTLHPIGAVPTEYTHRVAMVTFWRTFHHDEKISPAWWGCTPTSFHCIYHHVQSCSVRSSWETDTLPLFLLYTYISTLWLWHPTSYTEWHPTSFSKRDTPES